MMKNLEERTSLSELRYACSVHRHVEQTHVHLLLRREYTDKETCETRWVQRFAEEYLNGRDERGKVRGGILDMALSDALDTMIPKRERPDTQITLETRQPEISTENRDPKHQVLNQEAEERSPGEVECPEMDDMEPQQKSMRSGPDEASRQPHGEVRSEGATTGADRELGEGEDNRSPTTWERVRADELISYQRWIPMERSEPEAERDLGDIGFSR